MTYNNQHNQQHNNRGDSQSSYIVPTIEELALGDVSFYDIAEYFSQRSHFVFLDSRSREPGLAKHSFCAFDPFMIFTSKGNQVTIRQGTDGQEQKEESCNIFDNLDQLMRQYHIPSGVGNHAAPFIGGGIGYFAYELGRQVETLPINTEDVMSIPECYVCFYNALLIYNHQQQKMYLSYFTPHHPGPIQSLKQFKTMIEEVPAGLYQQQEISPGWIDAAEDEIQDHFKSDFTAQRYMDAINQIKEYILAGDIYQADMTQRFETTVKDLPPWQLYKRLMHLNPSPFASYLHFPEVEVVSSSPERFFSINGNYLETRPIKGTVKRGETPVEDEKNKEFHFNDEKNRAELAMIVDLMRNDISRVCRIGSVKVNAFPELESYPSVHHLVSTITGKLLEGKNTVDVLKATFPGGSIVGAPKIRALEILDQLEPVERDIYTGSIGYIGFNGNADLNIVIRTIIMIADKIHIQAGGGIVADSNDRDEYEETLLKSMKLFKTLVRDPQDAGKG
ncbi:MAG: aminodeoxychorismate synthase component I [bacterium]|nr:aminodeoxychorismate synthase component I [bacterium]